MIAIFVIILSLIIARIVFRKRQIYKCADCGRNDVKLYRPYGEFFRERRVKCNQHVPDESTDWYIPLIYDQEDGQIWGYSSVPQTDIVKWQKLPDANPFLSKWVGGWDWWK